MRTISLWSSRAVATMIGTLLTARTIWISFPPSRSGSPRSRTTRSGAVSTTACKPVIADGADATACPRSDSDRVSVVRIPGSSSISSRRGTGLTVLTRSGYLWTTARILFVGFEIHLTHGRDPRADTYRVPEQAPPEYPSPRRPDDVDHKRPRRALVAHLRGWSGRPLTLALGWLLSCALV